MSSPNLAGYDLIVVNSSAGKDSQATLHVICSAAKALGILDRVHVAHAAFPEEWQGTADLAREQALAYIPEDRFHVVRNLVPSAPDGSLLTRVRNRGQWPSSKTRYCTAEFKRGPVEKLIRSLTPNGGRVLNTMGIRAAESPARAKKAAFTTKSRLDTRTRTVHTYYPIFDYTLDQVWATVKASGTRRHPAYDAGLPRLSCVFCVFAPKAALMRAGALNRDLLAKHVQVEEEIGHQFNQTLSIRSIQDALEAGEEPGEVRTWEG